ncbi:hypothetical protein KUTeg_016432 [Tegillarca granosa]|uniref:Lipase domain-containing protein n=1 Tax=Tegillarca granosa TaxID=220873 RepID=A0ABQ9EKV2_TEGGR|nr:hypothetical protein KUTeg_016432 [Tegillarca granosa]
MELKNTTMLYLTILFLLCGLIGLSYGKTNITVSALNPTTTVNPKVNKTRCYPFVGCFGNAPPFTNSQLDLPGSPEQVGTQMFLYTRLNANRSQGDELADLNVVIVSWGPGAAFPNYDQAVANTRMVGTQIRLVIDLMIHAGCKLSDVHVIGHSLGAHTAGYAGYLLHGRIGRITGLDAAEPDFEKHPIETRLDKTDAVFVDAIHTNGASLLTGGAGLMEVSGHVDFYVNGGETQPGCPNQFSGTLSNIFHFHFGSK